LPQAAIFQLYQAPIIDNAFDPVAVFTGERGTCQRDKYQKSAGASSRMACSN
jgi:hypothetical protein